MYNRNPQMFENKKKHKTKFSKNLTLLKIFCIFRFALKMLCSKTKIKRLVVCLSFNFVRYPPELFELNNPSIKLRHILSRQFKSRAIHIKEKSILDLSLKHHVCL